ncbi:hypothetical protein D3C78_1129360 [compost metagenome]
MLTQSTEHFHMFTTGTWQVEQVYLRQRMKGILNLITKMYLVGIREPLRQTISLWIAGVLIMVT